MLRGMVFVTGCLLLFGGLVAGIVNLQPAGIEMAIVGLVLAGGVVFERWRYKPAVRGRPGARWRSTGERFFDPGTGKEIQVYFDPDTGDRNYVETGAKRPG